MSRCPNRNHAMIPALILVTLLFLQGTSAVLAAAEAPQVRIVKGMSRVVHLQGITRAAVADPEIADVAVGGKNELIVNGIKPGTTSLHIWHNGGRESFALLVYEDTTALVKEVTERIGRGDLHVWMARESLVLEGVLDGSEKERALKIAQVYADRVVDLLVDADSAPVDPAAALDQIINVPQIKTEVVDHTAILEGVVKQERVAERARAIAAASGYDVVDLIEIDSVNEQGRPLVDIVSKAISDPRLTVRVHNGVIFVAGQVEDEIDHRRAVEIAKAYGDRVVDLIIVKAPPETATTSSVQDVPEADAAQGRPADKSVAEDPNMARKISSLIGDRRIQVRVVGSNIFLEGTVTSELAQRRAAALASAFPLEVSDLIEVVPPEPEPKEPAESEPADPGPEDLAKKAAEAVRELQAKVSKAVGDSSVQVRVLNGYVFLEGWVSDEFVLHRAEEVAKAFEKPVVNLLRVKPQEVSEDAADDSADELKHLRTQIAAAIDNPEVDVRLVNGTIILEGWVAEDFAIHEAEQVAKAFGTPVVNLLRVEAQEVTAAEPPSTSAVKAEIEQAIDNPDVTVRIVNDTIVLDGQVTDEFAILGAKEVAQAFGKPVINLLRVRPVAPTPEETALDPAHELKALRDKVDAAIGDPGVNVRLLNGTLFLEGWVNDGFDRSRAESVASTFGPDVVNLLRVKPTSDTESEAEAGASDPQRTLAQRIRDEIGGRNIGVRVIEGTVLLEGQVADPLEKERADAIAEAFGQPVKSLIRVVAPVVASPDQEETQPDQLKAQIEDSIADPRIQVRVIGETVILEGRVEDEYGAKRAIAIARAFDFEVEDLLQRGPLPATHSEDVQAGAATAPPANGEHREGQEVNPDAAAAAGPSPEQKRNSELEALREQLHDRRIELDLVRGTLVMEGVVTSEAEHRRTTKLGQLFFKDILDFIEVVQPQETNSEKLDRVIARAVGRPDVHARIAGEKVLLEGRVSTQNERNRVLAIAGAFGKEVVNLLEVSDPQQVVVQVRAVELSKTGSRQLGITWGSMLRGVFNPNVAIWSETAINGALERISLISAELQTLVQDGHATILAAPSLLTLSGEEAQFLAGGEVPITVIKDEKVSVVWKEYGVRLNVTPSIERGGLIDLKVTPEVSTLDWANGIRSGGVLMPALRTRRATSRVEVASGSTVAIGGLLQNEVSKQVEKLPLLGNLPIIGRLFRSEKFKSNETELVFFITPYSIGPDGLEKANELVQPGDMSR